MYSIKAILTEDPILYYKNVQDGNKHVTASNIVLSNVSASAAGVYLSFTRKDQTFETGAILYKYSLPANSFLELKDRLLNPDQTIQAYCDTAEVVVLSVDILEPFGEYAETL